MKGNMKTNLIRTTDFVWLLASVWLTATLIVPYVFPPVTLTRGLVGLAFLVFAVFAAFADYLLFRGRLSALWPLAVQALAFAACSIYFFVIWRLYWNHGLADWQALFAILLSTVTLIVLAIARPQEKIC